MHFKNGREAKDGDQAVWKNQYTGQIETGRLTDLNAKATSCNVALARPLGAPIQCITVGECYHADDAFAAIEANQPAPAVAEAAPEAQPAPEAAPATN